MGVADQAMARVDERSSVWFEATVELSGAFEDAALAEAWSRLLDLHPILTCVREGRAWRPQNRPDGHSPASLRVTPISGGLRLTLLCDHVAFDGVASLILLGDLRDEYEAVIAGHPAKETDWSPRNLEDFAGGTDWRTVTAAALRSGSSWWRTAPSTHVDPGPSSDQPAEDHALLDLGPVLETLTPDRRRYRWSVDAVLVGVLEKAWSHVLGPPSANSSWLVARDLRPGLGVSRGIGNLSVPAGVSIPDPDADLMEVIDRANTALASQSRDLSTLGASLRGWRPAIEAAFAHMLGRSERMRAFRSVSNVGQLGDSLDRWGEAWLGRIWFVGPLAHPPYNSFIAAGHGASTLVSVRTSPGWLTAAHARALEKAVLEFV